jgi:DHA2 family multidrug resistance protein-like MFS transporter
MEAMYFADGLPAPQRWRAQLTIAIAVSVAVLGSVTASLALPTIAQDLGVTPAASVWVVNAYQIAIVMTLLPFASLGDGYGLRLVYGVGLAVFTVASLACALAPTLPWLVAARIVQGLGASGLMSVNVALVRHIFPRDLLGRGVGFNALVVALSSAAAPTLAAAILAVGDWPWLFAVNVPFGLLALALLGALPRTPLSGHRFDLASAVLNAATFGLFIAGVDGFGHGESLAMALLQIAASLMVGGVFVYRQLGLPAPMLPVDLLRRPVFALTVATSVCSFIAQTMSFIALPFLFISVMGRSMVEAGLMMTAWPVAVALTAPLSGRLSDRYAAGLIGGPGLAAMTVGLLLLLALPAEPSLADVAWRMALAGAGFALFQAPNNRQMMSSVPRHRSGAGSGMLSTSRLLGQTTGAALVGVLFGLTAAGGVGRGVTAAMLGAVGFSALGAVCSSLRLVRR